MKNFDLDSEGFGYSIAAGYEFIRHLQVGLYYTGGSTNADYATLNHHLLSLFVTVMAY